MNRRWRPRAGTILFVIMLFELAAFGVIMMNSYPEIDYRAPVVAICTVGMLFFQYAVLTLFFPNCDRYVLIIANFLAAVGLIIQYRINPDTALKQLVWMVLGMVGMIVTTIIIRKGNFFRKLKFPLMVLSGLMLAVSLAFRSQGGASGWVNIAGFSLQPSEFVKILLIFIIAALVTESGAGWQKLLIGVGYVGACLLLLLMQKDLGAALLYACTAIVMLYAGTGNKLLTLGTLGMGAAGSVAAYHMFSHVRVRVALWRNPWAMYEDKGYQVVQGLIAIASGGLFGLGLTKGMPEVLPVAHADYIFAVICEEFGTLFGLILVAFYLVFIIRGAIIALDSRNSFDALVSIGCVAMVTLQSFIIIGGVIKLIPLTGITLPFVSYGGSSMLSCYLILGILEGIAIKNGDADELEFQEAFEPDEDDYDDEYDYDDDEDYDDDYDDDNGYYEDDYGDD